MRNFVLKAWNHFGNLRENSAKVPSSYSTEKFLIFFVEEKNIFLMKGQNFWPITGAKKFDHNWYNHFLMLLWFIPDTLFKWWKICVKELKMAIKFVTTIDPYFFKAT